MQGLDEYAQGFVLRRVRPSLTENRFIAKDRSVPLLHSLEHHWTAEAPFAGIEPSQLMFVEAVSHTDTD
jgi:hypothetical protein